MLHIYLQDTGHLLQILNNKKKKNKKKITTPQNGNTCVRERKIVKIVAEIILEKNFDVFFLVTNQLNKPMIKVSGCDLSNAVVFRQ